jgi:hypothetical protein
MEKKSQWQVLAGMGRSGLHNRVIDSSCCIAQRQINHAMRMTKNYKPLLFHYRSKRIYIVVLAAA